MKKTTIYLSEAEWRLVIRALNEKDDVRNIELLRKGAENIMREEPMMHRGRNKAL